MPLVRFEVRNEYKLGGSQLYKDGVLAEDPKPVLDGLSVAGLVGILRQLGDLAEFAAEVFHGLQEQVASTSSRSRILVTRVQRIEASLPQLEKAILSQTSHIHYAYTPGCSLHARIRNAQNHFICDDLPSFIMDSYEESREPPRLQLLDRFDTGGPGSCLKRYFDPTFFRRASASSEVCNGEKPFHERKTRKMKRRTWKHSENSRKNSPFSKDSERMQSLAPIAQGPCSVSHTESTVDTTCKSDVVDSSDLGSKDVMDYIECELHPSTSVHPGDAKRPEPSSVQNDNTMGAHDSIYVYGQNRGTYSPSLEETVPHSSVTSDDKMVTGEYIHLNYGTNDLEYLIETKSDHDRELKAATVGCFDQVDHLNGHKSLSKSNVDNHFLKTTVNYIQDAQKENVNLVEPKLRLVDASVNTAEDSSERESVTDSHGDENYPKTIVGTQPDYAIDEAQDMVENYELHEHEVGPTTTECIAQVEDFPKSVNTSKLISDDCLVNDSIDRKWETLDEVHYAEPRQPYGPDCGIDDVQCMLENIELHEHGLGPATTDCIAQVEDLSRGESSARLISNESPRNDSLDRKWETIDDARFAEPSQLYGLNFGIDDVRYMLENFEPRELDLGPATTESRSQVEELSRGENYSEILSDGSPINDPFERTLTVSQIDDVTNNFDTVDEKLETINTEPVSQMDALPESENVVTVIEWNQLDDVDSETDQFVDALNTIESESESDFEGQTKKELISYSSCKDELVEYAEFVQKEELINHQQPEREFSCPSNYDKEDDIQNSNALATFNNMESLGHAEASCHVSVAAMISLFEPEHESDSVSFNYKEEVRDPSSAVVPMESIEHDQSSNNMVEAEISQLTGLQELERECDSVSLDDKEQGPDASLDSNAAVSLDSIEHPQSSCDVSAEDITSPQKAEVHSCDVVSDQKQQISDDSHNSAAPMSSLVKQSAADHSTCLSDEQPVQHIQSSCDVVAEEITRVQKPEVKSRDVIPDQMQQISDDSYNSAAPTSSPVVEPVVHAQSSYKQSAAEEDNELDHSTCLSDEQPVQHIQSSCDVVAEEITCVQKPAVKSHDVVSDQMQQISDDSHNSAAPMSSSIAEPVVHAQSSGELPASEEGNGLDHTACLNDEQSVQHIQSSSDLAEETVGAPHLSQGISVGSSSTYPPAFWTNGTLFGLQPSKPTVLSSPKTVNSNPISKTIVLNNMKKVENSAAGASSLKDPHGSIEPTMGNQDAENFSHCSHQTSDKQYEKSIANDLSYLSNGRITHHEVKAPSTANVENVSTVAINTRQEKPSLITLLGRELLRNGLRAGSFDYTDKSNKTIPMPNELENRSHASTLHSTPEPISKGKLNSPVSSPPPSPPLDHMKISFRPIDGFGTSRLKLKYPEGIDQHESIIDSFPSFQLVPEPSNLKAETGSDSDDDTFCRSYACMSDDYLGHLSDSNSDEWESGETSESNDPALYEGLRRISSTEFASSSPQCEKTDEGSINVCSISGHVAHSGSAPSFCLPTLGSQIPFSHKESTVCLHTEEIETPPFPPEQWRVSKPVLDPEDKHGQGSDSFNQPFHPNLSGPTIADLSKLDSAKQCKSKELATIPNTNELDEQQLDPQSLNNEATNVERAEDMDGFLHQIRKKSFNLRRTETARSSYMQNNTTNYKVTAILQKADAIRQAVASDGDDDSWSDT